MSNLTALKNECDAIVREIKMFNRKYADRTLPKQGVTAERRFGAENLPELRALQARLAAAELAYEAAYERRYDDVA